jgi:hypothetical protein
METTEQLEVCVGRAYELAQMIENNDYEEHALLRAYQQLKPSTCDTVPELKLRGEIAFLLAENYRNVNPDKASAYARECLAIYKNLPSDNEPQCSTVLSQAVPNLMHDGVVRNRLSDLLRHTPIFH